MSDNNSVCVKKKKFEWQSWFVYFALFGLILVFAVLNEVFLTPGNFENIGRQTAMVSIIALGATFVITTGNIDLSAGALVGLVGVVAAMCMRAGLSIPLSSIIGILVGVSFGLVNGILVAKARIPSFLVTLGTMGIARGLALTITNTKAVIIMDKNFTQFWGAGSVGGFPTSILWTIILSAIAIWLYHYTVFGNYVKAVGGNITAAIYSGVKADKVTIKVFVLAGVMAAIAGLLMAARLKSGRPEVGAGMELDAVAAVVLGGTVMSGGRGKMVNTLIGSLIMGVIVNGLIIMGVQTNIQAIIKGVIIIAAVSMSEKK